VSPRSLFVSKGRRAVPFHRVDRKSRKRTSLSNAPIRAQCAGARVRVELHRAATGA
jgi:hypothetical protein